MLNIISEMYKLLFFAIHNAYTIHKMNFKHFRLYITSLKQQGNG